MFRKKVLLLSLVSLVLSQEFGWEERLRSDIFNVDWDVPVNGDGVSRHVSCLETVSRHGSFISRSWLCLDTCMDCLDSCLEFPYFMSHVS